jgi:hypothetical protein
MSILDWRGGSIMDQIGDAVCEAIDETTEAAAARAASTPLDLPLHQAAGYWWFDISARVESTVTNEPAHIEGSTASGRFGTTQRRGGYGLFEERVFPFLRPAADAEFPRLAERIREKL